MDSTLTNVDSRGVTRGRCKVCPEECTEYEKIVGDPKNNCNYCGHTAPEHERVSASTPNSSASTPSFSASTPSFSASTPNLSTNASASPEIASVSSGDRSTPTYEVPRVSVDSFMRSVSACEDDDDVKSEDIPLPKALPAELEDVFVKKIRKPEEKHINRLTRDIVTGLRSADLKPSQVLFSKTSKKAVAKWSPLKVQGDKKHVGFARKLKKRYDKVIARRRRDSKTVPRNADGSIEETLSQLRKDWEDNRRNPATMKAYMDVLRESRMHQAKTQPAATHLQTYPALRLKSVLIHEFEALSKVTRQQMEERWVATLPKLYAALVNESLIPEDPTADIYQQTISVLKSLHSVKIWKKKATDDRRCRILEMFPSNTPLAETCTKNKEPPRLAAILNPDSASLSCHCYVDTNPLFVTDCPIEAVCLLIATFYAFNISWTPQAKLPLVLIASILIGPEQVIEQVSNNSRFVAFLRSLGLTL